MQCFYQKKKDTNLDDCFGVYSSHNNIDIYMLLHRIHLIFYQIRRLCNICFLFKNHNIKSMSKLAKKFNIKTQDLKYIYVIIY